MNGPRPVQLLAASMIALSMTVSHGVVSSLGVVTAAVQLKANG